MKKLHPKQEKFLEWYIEDYPATLFKDLINGILSSGYYEITDSRTLNSLLHLSRKYNKSSFKRIKS